MFPAELKKDMNRLSPAFGKTIQKRLRISQEFVLECDQDQGIPAKNGARQITACYVILIQVFQALDNLEGHVPLIPLTTMKTGQKENANNIPYRKRISNVSQKKRKELGGQMLPAEAFKRTPGKKTEKSPPDRLHLNLRTVYY
ncbi:MAG: hypothetical protein IJT68_04105 [Lentisphaeria bacterium]|nr:hypothetical protein [Lentisphaeria bacterium]